MKILMLVSRVPYPLDKGDKLRAYHQLKELSKHHEIHLCCLDDKKTDQKHINELNKFCESVTVIRLSKIQILINLGWAMFSSLPFQVWYFYQLGAQRKINALIKKIQPEHIYCQLIRTSEYVKHEHSIPKTLDYMDTFSKGIERRIEKERLFRSVFRSEARRLAKYEHRIFQYFENKTIISKPDRDLIYHESRNEIEIIPNGIDLDFFTPKEAEKKYDLVFVGNMSYAPNVDCALFLANEVLPLLIKENKNIQLLLAGASPVKAVKELESENITVTGWVEDIRDAYASGKIFIAPLNIGTGLQNKLLEAMSMGLPCITSNLANNALGAKADQDILIGETPNSYKELVIKLLNDFNYSQTIANNGKNYVGNKYSWEQSTNRLRVIMESSKI